MAPHRRTQWPAGHRARAWMFTLNNPTPEDKELLKSLGSRFLVYQLEKATGPPHLQGYAVFDSQRTLGSLHRSVRRAHWEPRRGTDQQAYDYCTKESTRMPGDSGPWEFGDRPRQGKRNDIDAMAADIGAGMPMNEVALLHTATWFKYHGAADRFRLLTFASARSRGTVTALPKIHIYWGASGLGKSRRAFYEAGGDAYSLSKPNSSSGALWWDGYTGQRKLVIDEFYSWMPRDLLQRICDRYPLQLQFKNGSVDCAVDEIWITSNQDPETWWARVPDPGLGAPMRRRIAENGEVIEFTSSWEPPLVAESSLSSATVVSDDEVEEVAETRPSSPVGFVVDAFDDPGAGPATPAPEFSSSGHSAFSLREKVYRAQVERGEVAGGVSYGKRPAVLVPDSEDSSCELFD